MNSIPMRDCTPDERASMIPCPSCGKEFRFITDFRDSHDDQWVECECGMTGPAWRFRRGGDTYLAAKDITEEIVDTEVDE